MEQGRVKGERRRCEGRAASGGINKGDGRGG